MCPSILIMITAVIKYISYNTVKNSVFIVYSLENILDPRLKWQKGDSAGTEPWIHQNTPQSDCWSLRATSWPPARLKWPAGCDILIQCDSLCLSSVNDTVPQRQVITSPYSGLLWRTPSPPPSGPCTTWWVTLRPCRWSGRRSTTSWTSVESSSAATKMWRSAENSWTSFFIWVRQFIHTQILCISKIRSGECNVCPQRAASTRACVCPRPPWTSVLLRRTSVCDWTASARRVSGRGISSSSTLRICTWTPRSMRSHRYNRQHHHHRSINSNPLSSPFLWNLLP